MPGIEQLWMVMAVLFTKFKYILAEILIFGDTKSYAKELADSGENKASQKKMTSNTTRLGRELQSKGLLPSLVALSLIKKYFQNFSVLIVPIC